MASLTRDEFGNLVYTSGVTDDVGKSVSGNQGINLGQEPGFRPDKSNTTDRAAELAALETYTGGASAAKNYYDLTKAVANGEVSMYSGGTFDPEVLKRPEYLNAIIQAEPRIEFGLTAEEKKKSGSTQPWASSSSKYRSEVVGKGDLIPVSERGDILAQRMESFAKALISAAPTGVEGQKAVKEFYRLALADINDKGIANLSVNTWGDVRGFGVSTGSERLVDAVTRSSSPDGIAKLTNDFAFDPGTFNADLQQQIDSVGSGFIINASSGQLPGNKKGPTGGTIDAPDPFNPLDTEGSGFEEGGSSNAMGLFRPQDISDDVKEVLSEIGMDLDGTGGDGTGGDGSGTGGGGGGGGFGGFDPTVMVGNLQSIDDIIANFTKTYNQQPTISIPLLDAEGNPVRNPDDSIVQTQITNPLLAQMIDIAGVNNGFISDQQIAVAQAQSTIEVAEIQKLSALAEAHARGASDEEIARINQQGDFAIASAQTTADKYISQNNLTGVQAQAQASIDAATQTAMGAVSVADIQSAAERDIAQIQANVGIDANAKEQAIAEIQAAAQKDIATTQAGGQVAASQAAAGAASPYGFMQQGGTPNQLEQIFAGQNAVGLANAAAQKDAARAGATGFGALLSGDTAQQANANAILRAQAANNAYAAQQLGQDESRIDQILRGGLSAEQRLAEINAGQSGQNQANFLNFIGNPSAVGFAKEQGLFSPGQGLNASAGSNVLQDISNSESGNIPGSLFGFNPPTATGAGGGATQNISDTGRNFNANTLRNASDEQIGFIQGAEAARGRTPSEFRQKVESFTPQGY